MKRKKLIPLPLLILIDVLAIALCLNVYALFHRGLVGSLAAPSRSAAPSRTVSVIPTPSPKPAPTPTAAADTAEPAAEEAPAEQEEASEAADSPADEAPAPVSFESEAPIGYEVGQQLADFSVPTFDGGEFRLSDTRGKIVFLNLWGTYCTPCVQELPEFEKLCEEHEGELVILAIHSSLTGEQEPDDYVRSKGWDDWLLSFALDDDDDTIFEIVNGSTTLPQTIVLNRKGEVIYNMVGSVTPVMLESLYREADASAPGAPTA